MAEVGLDLKALALVGARARLAELEAERDSLLRTFPQLREQSEGRSRAPVARRRSGPVARRRSRMSAAARKAVSERMKRYWAARREAKKR